LDRPLVLGAPDAAHVSHGQTTGTTPLTAKCSRQRTKGSDMAAAKGRAVKQKLERAKDAAEAAVDRARDAARDALDRH
jgi:hypothetical protein